MRDLPIWEYKKARSEDEINLRRLVDIDHKHEEMKRMNREVRERSDINRKRRIEPQKKKTTVRKTNVFCWRLFLVRRARSPGHKMQLMWVGPRQIIACNSV